MLEKKINKKTIDSVHIKQILKWMTKESLDIMIY